MSTWFDSENPDVKSSYKLPHHRAEGHNTVWRGVAAAMVALLGGRGGVDIPDDDRRGVYNHLSRHYGEFDKDPPEFKHYTAADLKAMDVGPSAVEEEPEMESIRTSDGTEVSGGWEAVDKETDPVERMRMEGLSKEVDGMVPVTTELWNSIMDGFRDMTAKESAVVEPEQDVEDKIELTAEETSLIVQQALKIREQNDALEKYAHALKVVNAKLEVLQGGIG
jgi:hypothetical protein